MEAKEIAKLICLYNGQKATDKQIEKCLNSFKNDVNQMLQFCKGRIKT